jgi:hypothetical protein
MDRHRKPAWIAVIAVLVLVSCAIPHRQTFLNQAHRVNLSLDDEELKRLPFYLSTNVLVHYDGPSGTQALFFPGETPGIVTAVGPDWLQVSFREGGAEAPFVVDPRGPYGVYYVATELPGQVGFHRLKDLPQKVFYYDGTPYQVIYGDEAHLQVDDQALQTLLQSRIPTEGRRP